MGPVQLAALLCLMSASCRPLLTAIAREVAKQALDALSHPSTAHMEPGRNSSSGLSSGSSSKRGTTSSGNPAQAVHSSGDVGLPSLAPHVLLGQDCSPSCCYVCSSSTAPVAGLPQRSVGGRQLGVAMSENADAGSCQSSSSNSSDCLAMEDAATARGLAAEHVAAHSLVQLLSVLSSAGGCGVLLLETAAKLLRPHLHVLSPKVSCASGRTLEMCACVCVFVCACTQACP
eukprot:scaffold101656_cov21-Tisochrysis_lutea.AAC.6